MGREVCSVFSKDFYEHAVCVLVFPSISFADCSGFAADAGQTFGVSLKRDPETRKVLDSIWSVKRALSRQNQVW